MTDHKNNFKKALNYFKNLKDTSENNISKTEHKDKNIQTIKNNSNFKKKLDFFQNLTAPKNNTDIANYKNKNILIIKKDNNFKDTLDFFKKLTDMPKNNVSIEKLNHKVVKNIDKNVVNKPITKQVEKQLNENLKNNIPKKIEKNVINTIDYKNNKNINKKTNNKIVTKQLNHINDIQLSKQQNNKIIINNENVKKVQKKFDELSIDENLQPQEKNNFEFVIKKSFKFLCEKNDINGIISIIISKNNRNILIDKSDNNFFSEIICKNGIELIKQVILDKRISNNGLELLILKELFKFVNKKENIHFFDELINDKKIEKLILNNLLEDNDQNIDKLFVYTFLNNFENIAIKMLTNKNIKEKLLNEQMEIKSRDIKEKPPMTTIDKGIDTWIAVSKIRRIMLNPNIINIISSDNSFISKIQPDVLKELINTSCLSALSEFDNYKKVSFNFLNSKIVEEKLDEIFSIIISSLNVRLDIYLNNDKYNNISNNCKKDLDIIIKFLEQIFNSESKIKKISNIFRIDAVVKLLTILYEAKNNIYNNEIKKLINIVINNDYIKNHKKDILVQTLSKAYDKNLKKTIKELEKDEFVINNKMEIYSEVLEKACLLNHKETVKKITENSEIIDIIIKYNDNNLDKNIIDKCFNNASNIGDRTDSSVVLKLLLENEKIKNRIINNTDNIKIFIKNTFFNTFLTKESQLSEQDLRLSSIFIKNIKNEQKLDIKESEYKIFKQNIKKFINILIQEKKINKHINKDIHKMKKKDWNKKSYFEKIISTFNIIENSLNQKKI